MVPRLVFAAACLIVLLPPDHAGASNCAGTSTGLIPLIDLGTGFYQGAQGGLYPGGSNTRPPAHLAAGLAIANAIAPLDTFGNPDPNGRVVLISIGMSNTTMEFSTFVPKANADPAKRADVLVVDCAQGGQAASDIKDPNAPYWSTVATRLRQAHSSPAQAQVVWLKEALRGPTGGFPAATDTLRWYLGSIVRVIKDKLPNARICYLASRIYAGYASTTLNPEPYAYESGFAVKGLIATQMSGEDSLNFDPAAGPVEAPWLTWGPYLWADGLNPRSDGLIWTCDDFNSDGTHPTTAGRDVVADSLLAFFKRDETAVPWFVNGLVAVGGTPAQAPLFLAPNPARTHVELSAPWPFGSVEVMDVAGRRLFSSGALRWMMGPQTEYRYRWDLRDDAGRRVPNGLYWIRVQTRAARLERRVLVVEAR